MHGEEDYTCRESFGQFPVEIILKMNDTVGGSADITQPPAQFIAVMNFKVNYMTLGFADSSNAWAAAGPSWVRSTCVTSETAASVSGDLTSQESKTGTPRYLKSQSQPKLDAIRAAINTSIDREQPGSHEPGMS